MKHTTLQITKKQHTMHLYAGKELFINNDLWQKIIDDSSSIVLITDTNVYRYYTNFIHKLTELTPHILVYIIPAGESSKSRVMKEKLEDQLMHARIDRNSSIVALGGGTVTDLAGFIASTYLRGISLYLIPTSLLAMVDASIGGKTAINTAMGKNLLGSFYFPKAIYIDTFFLQTLPKQELISGLAEIIKYGCIYDASLFELLERTASKHSIDFLTTVIDRSLMIKQEIVKRDVYNKEFRHILNFGHTLGHGIELCERYTLSHGQAVALGMLGEAYLSHHMGRLPCHDFVRICSLIKECAFDLRISSHLSPLGLFNALTRDKKTTSQVPHCVLLTAIGTVSKDSNYLYLIDKSHWMEVIQWLITNFSCNL